MNSKLSQIPLFNKLSAESRDGLTRLCSEHHFSFQQLRQLVECEADLFCWGEDSLLVAYGYAGFEPSKDKRSVKKVFDYLEKHYHGLKDSQKSYGTEQIAFSEIKNFKEELVTKPLDGSIMGQCPVASEKTRCCNLRTLDAVRQCGFDCSYCSIQSFYYNNQVAFTEDFVGHLERLELDPNQYYHIGTGQSSDSLMWGNKDGLLDALCRFAENNPNIILELKSKSSNISYFEQTIAPQNMLFTWSLNTPAVIAAEEKGAANLYKRLESARKLADRGFPVGFHFHPMVWYQGWEKDYTEIVQNITKMFSPLEVVLISLGTLTFIKPVLKRIRERMLKSSILQMPMVEIAGKQSYPFEIKQEMFSTLYGAFPKEWQDEVFFYMCMEDKALWEPVFGRSYETNEEFEADMIASYRAKLEKIAMARPA